MACGPDAAPKGSLSGSPSISSSQLLGCAEMANPTLVVAPEGTLGVQYYRSFTGWSSQVPHTVDLWHHPGETPPRQIPRLHTWQSKTTSSQISVLNFAIVSNPKAWLLPVSFTQWLFLQNIIWSQISFSTPCRISVFTKAKLQDFKMPLWDSATIQK